MASLPTFQSTTLEGAFLEAAFLLQRGELNYLNSGDWKSLGENYVVPSFINITVDTEQQRVTINATLPVASAPNSFGGYFVAYQFLQNKYLTSTFNPVNQFYTSTSQSNG